jgi:hypothetical protein
VRPIGKHSTKRQVGESRREPHAEWRGDERSSGCGSNDIKVQFNRMRRSTCAVDAGSRLPLTIGKERRRGQTRHCVERRDGALRVELRESTSVSTSTGMARMPPPMPSAPPTNAEPTPKPNARAMRHSSMSDVRRRDKHSNDECCTGATGGNGECAADVESIEQRGRGGAALVAGRARCAQRRARVLRLRRHQRRHACRWRVDLHQFSVVVCRVGRATCESVVDDASTHLISSLTLRFLPFF